MKTILALLFNFVLVALAFALVGRAAAAALPYQVRGSIDVGTLENSVFSLGGTMYLLENINSGYIDNAGRWFDEFRGHSYARVRRLDDGVVVVNISSTIGYVRPRKDTVHYVGTLQLTLTADSTRLDSILTGIHERLRRPFPQQALDIWDEP